MFLFVVGMRVSLISILFMSQSMQGSSRVGVWVVAAAAVLGISLIIAACLIQRGYVKAKENTQDNVATLIGLADKVVKSDRAKWSLTISRPGTGKIEDTAKNLQEDEKTLRTLLNNAGIKDAILSIQPANISAGEGSYASQVMVIETDKVDALSGVASLAPTDLARRNATVSTNSIEYYYSDLSTLQKELVKQALEDANTQAKEVLGQSRPSISSISYGQAQVTPEYGSMMYYGNNDTSSIGKRVSLNVSVTFKLNK